MEFSTFFEKYKKIVESADKVFEQIKKEHPHCVKCKIECSDCCHALFDISFVEALYISLKFRETFNGAELGKLLEKTNKADRQIYKLKKEAYRDFKEGKDETAIFEKMAEERIRCPMLNESNQCDIYEFRPITCRLYGVPTAIGGKGHTCGLSDFTKGKSYPTVNLDAIHQALFNISSEIVKHIGSKYSGLPEMVVPLSMALLTVYDEEYLGIDSDEKKKDALDEEGKKDDESGQ
jgi:Fe-S-cluster containining protein